MKLCKCSAFGRRWKRPMRAGRIAGVICILLAVLLLLLCAPGWLIALIVSSLLFALGSWLLFGICERGRTPPFR